MTTGTGLKGVVLDETRIAFIDGEEGKLVYEFFESAFGPPAAQ